MRLVWVLFFSLGLAACTGLPWNAVAPKVSVADVAIKNLSLFEQHLDVGLRISNPNDFDLTVETLEFELEVNGRPFASGLSRTRTRTPIPAAASAMLRVDTLMQASDLIQQFKTLSPDALKDGVTYRVKGRIKTDQSSRWLPFDHTGVVGGGEKKSKD
ncbi:MAG: LEA type 2 family protein [Thiobacillus sp.]|nr:LEA type 2 family protein [Thiobacillus sp.]